MPEATLLPGESLTLFLGGDVMLGRGVDQILPFPGAPDLRERHIHDARTYVDLAAEVNGGIPTPVDWSWPWGEALPLLDDARCDLRIVNLETSITTSGDFAPGKGIHYRMHPANLPALAAIRPDVSVLANNHVLDFGRRGLLETLDVLSAAGLRGVGAGRNRSEAEAPAVIPVPRTGGRILVLAFGTPSSGIPLTWAATSDRPGVNLVRALTDAAADALCDRASRDRQPGDVVIVSVHWGTNWGYAVDAEQIRFAQRLLDGGVDLVFGHSSHHARPLEVHRGKLILYGCGDLVDDYEGIRGHHQYRDDLRLLYLVRVNVASGQLIDLRMVPLQARQLRLRQASFDDAAWLQNTLNEASRPFGSRIDMEPGGVLALRP